MVCWYCVFVVFLVRYVQCVWYLDNTRSTRLRACYQHEALELPCIHAYSVLADVHSALCEGDAIDSTALQYFHAIRVPMPNCPIARE